MSEEEKELQALFKSAENDLNNVAKKYGFAIRLVDTVDGTFYFFPEVERDYFKKTKILDIT